MRRAICSLCLRIALPAGEDKALGDLMREWRDEKPYDPRQGMSA